MLGVGFIRIMSHLIQIFQNSTLCVNSSSEVDVGTGNEEVLSKLDQNTSRVAWPNAGM